MWLPDEILPELSKMCLQCEQIRARVCMCVCVCVCVCAHVCLCMYAHARVMKHVRLVHTYTFEDYKSALTYALINVN